MVTVKTSNSEYWISKTGLRVRRLWEVKLVVSHASGSNTPLYVRGLLVESRSQELLVRSVCCVIIKRVSPATAATPENAASSRRL